ncbi:hypothetical protein I6H01_03920 [Escherichia coli]|uniref:ATP-grasp fold amidoligase family protein n=2 Tax=Escherichia coli TaxID=562 RepID=UPI000689F394|nr:ATP-grasp fold amidoligase family protein [Escherichia coli]EHD3364139.1 glycosyl transferase [Escherichia coli O124]EFK2888055.1 glycosyl transferase [Escherichia coli]EFK6635052.1 glycosyl transferase [Escherichia coli]EFK6690639.1 glycosyl transferase [Escherichia coli]EIT4552307.1 hypothetical protein [Escherichia coli]
MNRKNLSMKLMYILYNIKYLLKCFVVLITPDSLIIKKQFLEYQGYPLGLNNPKTLNQKLQWLKLNDRTLLHTICADKIRVREYVENRLGTRDNIIDLLKVYDTPFDITFESLPQGKFVIKSNHYCGDYFIVRDKNLLNIDEVKWKFIRTLNCNIYHHGREWQYKNIDRRIIVERLLEDEAGKVPNDIKIHCFNGEPKFIYVSLDREGGNYRSIYDTSWNMLDFCWARRGKDLSKFNVKNISKPSQLENALNISKKLSQGFKYLRVDLYLVQEKIYVGELTFHQGSGYDKITPFEWDERLGKELKL